MLIEHHHIPLQIKNAKRRKLINQKQPFVIILSGLYGLLNYTLVTVLEEYGYDYIIKEATSKQLMDYTLPIICCEDVVLQKQALIDLLCDICFGQYGADQFLQRKQNLKNIYRSWLSILNDQYEEKNIKKQLHEITRNQHTNKLFESFINVSIFVVNKGYQKQYKNYNARQFNLESVFVADLTWTILDKFSHKQSDYVLRGYFNQQIDFSENYRQMLVDRNQEPFKEVKIVLLDDPEPKEENYSNVSLNPKWFAGIFTSLALLYIAYSK